MEPQDAPVIDAAVAEEATVFNGGDGGNEVGREILVGDEAALGVVLVGEAGDEEGLQLVGGERAAVFADNLGDGVVGKADGGAVLRVVGLGAGMDGDGAGVFGVSAHG